MRLKQKPAECTKEANRLKANLQADRPIFMQIKETIEDDILQGRLGADDKIPSTNELVAYYSINPITVMKGVSLLVDEGIVYKKRGVGMFVSPDAREKLMEKHKPAFFDEYVKGTVEKSKQLSIPKDSLIEMIDRAWEGDDNDD